MGAKHLKVAADFVVVRRIDIEFSERDLGEMRHLVSERCAHLVIVAVPSRPTVHHRERI